MASIVNVRACHSARAAINYAAYGTDNTYRPARVATSVSTYGPDEALAWIEDHFKRLPPTTHGANKGLKPREGMSIIQSFDPKEFNIKNEDDIDKACEMGEMLAMRIAPNSFYVVQTHTDSMGQNIHNHIFIMNRDLTTNKSLRYGWLWKHARKENDYVMQQYGYTPVEPYKKKHVQRSHQEIMSGVVEPTKEERQVHKEIQGEITKRNRIIEKMNELEAQGLKDTLDYKDLTSSYYKSKTRTRNLQDEQDKIRLIAKSIKGYHDPEEFTSRSWRTYVQVAVRDLLKYEDIDSLDTLREELLDRYQITMVVHDGKDGRRPATSFAVVDDNGDVRRVSGTKTQMKRKGSTISHELQYDRLLERIDEAQAERQGYRTVHANEPDFSSSANLLSQEELDHMIETADRDHADSEFDHEAAIARYEEAFKPKSKPREEVEDLEDSEEFMPSRKKKKRVKEEKNTAPDQADEQDTVKPESQETQRPPLPPEVFIDPDDPDDAGIELVDESEVLEEHERRGKAITDQRKTVFEETGQSEYNYLERLERAFERESGLNLDDYKLTGEEKLKFDRYDTGLG